MGCILYKAPAIEIDKTAQSAWDERNDVTYYLVNGCASSCDYSIENCHITLHTSDAAPGYVNGCVILDETHADYETVMPGTASRDMSNMHIEIYDGKEYLYADEYDYRYISEKHIPLFEEDMTGVDLKTDEASWYKLSGTKDVTLRLDIPDHAAVYVYDQYGNIRYSSHMTDYGNVVPLPENGMIVFIGETGGHIAVSRVK